MKKTSLITLSVSVALVLLVGFHVLAAAGAPEKANKHLSAKVPVTDVYKPDKHLSDKGLGAWLVTPVLVVGAALAPWTVGQAREVKRLIQCARNSSYC